MSAPGTWREADGSAVRWADAEAAWALDAREVLLGVACVYRAVITYKELAAEVQRSDVHTRSGLQNWIGGVLERVARDCARRGEPQLTALCVRQDGTVGDGYVGAIEGTRGVRPKDADEHAAAERLECHRFFGADLPADGGSPALTEQVVARRRRALPTPHPRPATLCPTCFTEMPLSGRCDACG